MPSPFGESGFSDEPPSRGLVFDVPPAPPAVVVCNGIEHHMFHGQICPVQNLTHYTIWALAMAEPEDADLVDLGTI